MSDTSAFPHNLPPHTDAFVGRETALADLAALLRAADTRVITLLVLAGPVSPA